MLNQKLNFLEQGHAKCLSTHIEYWEKNFVPIVKDSEFKKAKQVYCDSITESLLLHCKPQVENVIGKEIVPSYSFWRTYFKGEVLKRHSDRASCQISVTLCIDMSDDKDPWDIFVDGYAVKLQRGEGVVYRGFSQEHWREPLLYDWHRQVFLHYIEKDGPFYPEHKYDGRKNLYTNMQVEK